MNSEQPKMTVEEASKYGREINARSAQYENYDVPTDGAELPAGKVSPPLSNEEIMSRVGEQNYQNVKGPNTMNSLNS